MQLTTVLVPLFASIAVGLPAVHKPAQLETRQYTPCSGLEGTAVCCSVDVLGLADLDCGTPTTTPANATDFQSICSSIGKAAKCCVLSLLDQSLICATPTGITE